MCDFVTDNYKYNKLIDCLNSKFDWLVDAGFIRNSIRTEYSKLLGESLVIDYKNIVTGVGISLFFKEKLKNYPDHFSVFVENKAGNNFILTSYLKKHKLEHYNYIFSLENESITFEVFIENFFEKLNHLLKTELKQVIEGERWEEVPFDWYGYK